MSYLTTLQDLGIPVSRYIVLNSYDYSLIGEYLQSDEKKKIEPSDYCWITYAADEKIKKYADLNGHSFLYFNDNLQLKNNKINLRDLLIKKGINYPKSYIVEGLTQLKNEFDKLKEMGFERVILKKPYGASGKGSFILDDKKQINSCYRYFMKKTNNSAILEGFYENALNFNYQIYISQDGNNSLFFMSDQIIRQLIYSGSSFPTKLDDKYTELITESAERIGRMLYNDGIRGVVGIDGFVANNQVFPAIDVNVRFTMSTYFTKLQSVFGSELKYQTSISDLFIDKPLTYEKLKSIMLKEKIFFNKTTKSGVFIMLSGPLPREKDERTNKYQGRIYSIAIGSDWKQVEQLSSAFNLLIDELER